MYDTDIRWFALIPVTFLLGLAVLASDIHGVWGGIPCRPDLFWCLAFTAALKSPPTPSIMAFAWCGLARDMLVGPRAGSAGIAFVVVGWLVLYWKSLVAVRGVIGQVAFNGTAAFLVAVIKHTLDAGSMAYVIPEKFFFLALGDGLLTALAYVPVMLVLALPPFRPWIERRRH